MALASNGNDGDASGAHPKQHWREGGNHVSILVCKASNCAFANAAVRIIPHIPASEPRSRPTRAAFPIGSTWEKIDVEPEKAAGYRFFPTQPREVMQYATRKRRLDVAERDNLCRSLLAATYFALRHQSRWLDEMVFVFRPPESFLFTKKTKLTPQQVGITAASPVCNFLVAMGLIVTAADYLWKLRSLSWLHGSAETPAAGLSGVLLTVIGFSKSVEGVESDDAEWWQRIIEVALAAICRERRLQR
jgi:hypothetical protein